MKNLDGAMLGLIAGLFYFAFSFVMGWETGGLVSLVLWIVVASLITFVVITALVSWFPPSRIWLYPLTFALPVLLIGLIALSEYPYIPTFAAIGSATFLVGLGAAFLAQKRVRNRLPRSNPPLNMDAPPSGSAPVN